MRINPVFKNEIRLGSRTMKLTWIVFIYNGVLAIVSLLVFFGMLNSARISGVIEYSSMLELYIIMAYIEFGMLILIVPALTAGSITGEREHQTLEVLLTTKMRPWQIVWGKLESSLSTVLLLSVSSLPVVSLVFVYGGIGLSDLLILVLILLVSAVFMGSIGILYSSLVKRTTTAHILTYTTIILIFVGTFAIVGGTQYIKELQAQQITPYLPGNGGVGGIIYILMINPVVSFLGLISNQAGSNQAILNICNNFGDFNENGLIHYWVFISMGIQFLFSVLMLWGAAKKIDPLKK